MARARGRRRFMQFSIRAMLLVMLLTALGLGTWRRFALQERAAQALVARGAKIEWRAVGPAWLRTTTGWTVERKLFRDAVVVRAEHCRIGDDDLENLRRMPCVERLYLAGNRITDQGLEHLRGLKRLKRLSLWHTAIKGEGYRRLANLKALQVLDIHDGHAVFGSTVGLGPRHFPVLPDNVASPDSGMNCRILESLAGLDNLRALYFSFPVDDRGIAALARLPKLRVKSLRLEKVSNSGLAPIGKLKDLDTLVVDRSSLTDDGLVHLASLPNLRRLSLAENRITDAGLAHLARLSRLEELVLDSTQVRGSGLAPLSGLGRLSSLSLRHTRIDDRGLSAARELVRLEELNLLDTAVTCNCLEHLVGMRRLKRLFLQQPLDDTAMAHLGQLSELRELHRGDRQTHELYLTDDGLARIANTQCFRQLRIQEARAGKSYRAIDQPRTSAGITEAGLVHLWDVPGLTHASVAVANWEPVMVQLRQSFPPAPERRIGDSVESVRINGGAFYVESATPGGRRSLSFLGLDGSFSLGVLKSTPHVKRIEFTAWPRDRAGESAVLASDWDVLRFVPEVEELQVGVHDFRDGFEATALRHVGDMKNLRVLRCCLAEDVLPEHLLALAGLKRLEELEIRLNPFNAEHFKFLAGLENLRVLRLLARPQAPEDERALESLIGLKRLQELRLNGCGDLALSHVGRIESLTRLHFEEGSATDKGLRYLLKLPSLSYLDMRPSRNTPMALNALRSAHPGIKIRTR